MSTALPLRTRSANARPGPSERRGFAARIESVGACLPERRLSTDELMARCRPTVHVELARLTGVRERRICSDGEDTVTLAVGAAQDCLAHSEREAADLDLVISCSISRFRGGLSTWYEPPIALAVKQAIGARRAASFDVTNACAGMMTGVLILEDFIRRGAARRGLVVSGEYITSLGLNAAQDMRTIASRQMASLTVGDAGAAVLVERADDGVDRIEASGLATFARYDGLCIGRVCRHRPGGAMFTSPRRLHDAAIQHSVPVVARVFDEAGLTPDDIDLYVPHQTSRRAIRAGQRHIEKQLGAQAGNRQIAVTLGDYGNTASTAIFLALHDYLQKGRVARGDKVMLMCFASGLVVGATILTVDALVGRYGRDH